MLLSLLTCLGGKAQLGGLEEGEVGGWLAPVFPSGTVSNQKGSDTAQGGEAVGSPSLSFLTSGCGAGT